MTTNATGGGSQPPPQTGGTDVTPEGGAEPPKDDRLVPDAADRTETARPAPAEPAQKPKPDQNGTEPDKANVGADKAGTGTDKAAGTGADKVTAGTDRPGAKPDKAGSEPDEGGAEPGKATAEVGKDEPAPGTGKAEPGTADTAGDGADRADRKDPPAEADPWTSFAPEPEPVPGRPRRAAHATGRFLVHEWTLAVLASLALAVGMTWPTLRYPLYTLPQDYWDPSLQAWQMAWSGHALRTDPGQLFQSNTFFPEPWSFAFSDMLLGYAPAGLLGTGPDAAVLRYNIMFVLAHAMATFGAYVLARQMGAGRIGSAVAGVAYTYAPWLLAQAGHLHIVSNGGIPLALAMLARGHGWSLRHGYRPERRRVGWAYAGWVVAAWQLSLGFGIGLVFAYVLAVTLLVSAAVWFWRRRRVRRPFGRRLFVADLVGGLLFAAIGALLAVPYFKVAELHPNAERTLGDVGVYSPPASGFFTAPAESWIWGGLHEGRGRRCPGTRR